MIRRKYILVTVLMYDDTKMKKYITHPKYKLCGNKNIGSVLPIKISEYSLFADPTYQAKCVVGIFFEMTKCKKSLTRCLKINTLCMKKYYSYFIK